MIPYKRYTFGFTQMQNTFKPMLKQNAAQMPKVEPKPLPLAHSKDIKLQTAERKKTCSAQRFPAIN